MPKTDMSVSRIALGSADLGGKWDRTPFGDDIVSRARTIVDTALELGINFIDTADIYCYGKSEEVLGRVLAENRSLRAKLIIQSKCGNRFRADTSPSAPQRFDHSYEYIVW